MKTKLNNIASWFVVITFLSGFIYIFLWGFYNYTYQLTDKSFSELEEFNSEVMKLQKLEKFKFKRLEELKFEVLEILDPNYFDKYYALENYLSEEHSEYIYSPNFDKIKTSLNVTYLDYSPIANKKYREVDSLYSDVYKIIGHETIHLSYTDHVITEHYTHFQIRPMKDLVIPRSVINQLKDISNICFDTKEEFEQEVRKKIGLETFEDFDVIIDGVTGRQPSWLWHLFLFLLILFICSVVTKGFLEHLISKENEAKKSLEIEQNISDAKENVKINPNTILPIWDLASNTLQKYYNKNIEQVNSIYKLSIAVMLMGFVLIVSIIISSIYFSINSDFAVLGIVAGIITEFIGATFLFIYKSTVKQALEHSKSLEKINNVGMSIKILESIQTEKDNRDELTKAKIEIAKKLLSND